MVPRRPQLGRAVAAVWLAVLVLSGAEAAAGVAEEAGQILDATGI